MFALRLFSVGVDLLYSQVVQQRVVWKHCPDRCYAGIQECDFNNQDTKAEAAGLKGPHWNLGDLQGYWN